MAGALSAGLPSPLPPWHAAHGAYSFAPSVAKEAALHISNRMPIRLTFGIDLEKQDEGAVEGDRRRGSVNTRPNSGRNQGSDDVRQTRRIVKEFTQERMSGPANLLRFPANAHRAFKDENCVTTEQRVR